MFVMTMMVISGHEADHQNDHKGDYKLDHEEDHQDDHKYDLVDDPEGAHHHLT